MPNLRVYPVPESGFVPLEGAVERWVGAVLDPVATKAARGKVRLTVLPGVHTVPFTRYYATAVREGHLAAADEETARLCGSRYCPPAPTLTDVLEEPETVVVDPEATRLAEVMSRYSPDSLHYPKGSAGLVIDGYFVRECDEEPEPPSAA